MQHVSKWSLHCLSHSIPPIYKSRSHPGFHPTCHPQQPRNLTSSNSFKSALFILTAVTWAHPLCQGLCKSPKPQFPAPLLLWFRTYTAELSWMRGPTGHLLLSRPQLHLTINRTTGPLTRHTRSPSSAFFPITLTPGHMSFLTNFYLPFKTALVPLVWTVPEEPPHILLTTSNTCTHLYPTPSLNRSLTYTWQWASWRQIFSPLLTCWQVVSTSNFGFVFWQAVKQEKTYTTTPAYWTHSTSVKVTEFCTCSQGQQSANTATEEETQAPAAMLATMLSCGWTFSRCLKRWTKTSWNT